MAAAAAAAAVRRARHCLTHAVDVRAVSSGGGGGPAAAPSTTSATRPARPIDFSDTRAAFASKSTVELARSLLIFRLCTVRPLVANAGKLYRLSLKWLGRGLTGLALKLTFFHQFCAGEDEHEIVPTLKRLRAAGIGSILDYAAEADVADGPALAPQAAGAPPSRSSSTGLSHALAMSERELDGNLTTTIAAVRASKREGGFAAVKLTSLAQPELLRAISTMLHDHRRAFRRFNVGNVAEPFTDLRVAMPDFVRIMRGPRLREEDAVDLFRAIDYAGDGVVDFSEWSDFLALLRIGDVDAQMAAAHVIRGASPGQVLSVCVPAASIDLRPEQQIMLRNLLGRSDALALAASSARVSIMVDAEQSYLQPAIDYVVTNMMRKHNRRAATTWRFPESAHIAQRASAAARAEAARVGVTPRTALDVDGGQVDGDSGWPYNPASSLQTVNERYATAATRRGQAAATAVAAEAAPGDDLAAGGAYPVVYNTYQAYLRDTPARLALLLARSTREGFLCGTKLVRGAYMLQERALAKEKGYNDPIHPDIAATHACYHACLDAILPHVRDRGAEVMVASHNEASIVHTVQRMAELDIEPTRGGVSFGQLLGMCDHITFTLGAAGYSVHKYVPYGAVHLVVPYLIRRAEENSDVLGGVGKEIATHSRELRRRLQLPAA